MFFDSMQTMNALKLALNKQPIVYIARDIERALGLGKEYENYHIITNSTPFAKSLTSTTDAEPPLKNITLIPGLKPLDTHELLAHPTTIEILKHLGQPGVLVFKNTPAIERLCFEQGFNLLNPPAELSRTVEEKISQLDWLGDLERFLPPHTRLILKDISYTEACAKLSSPPHEGFILQFNRAHTGSGTMHIRLERDLEPLYKQFPNRPVRLTRFVRGPMFTSNNVVWGDTILVGNINYQITGLTPFTDRPFATIGNDWALPHELLSPKLKNEYHAIATAVGKKLAYDGWKGLFGIDVILDEDSQKLYLIEINARQPASTTYESLLQEKERAQTPSAGLTTFEAHLGGLLNLPYSNEKLVAVTDGAQIIQRVCAEPLFHIRRAKKVLREHGYNVILYPNTEIGDDLLRIQSAKRLMKAHNTLNEAGTAIARELVTPVDFTGNPCFHSNFFT